MTVRAWDIETQTHARFKRKASPWHPENYVVTHAFQGPGDALATEHRFGNTPPGPGWFEPVLKSADGKPIKLLVGMNIKFDLLWALQDGANLEAWMQWVADGGMIWDIQLAEYLLDGMKQESHMLSLDEIAPRYGGQVKIDEVKLLWQAGVQTADIEPSLLSRYLCGTETDLGDVGNTLKVAQGQITAARERGQLRSILMNMDSLLATIEMERNGMFIDRGRAEALREDLLARLIAAQAELKQYVPGDFPTQFVWTNRFHLSPLLFGGKVRYDRREYVKKDGAVTWVCPGPDVQDPEAYAYSQRDVVCVYPVNTAGLGADLIDGNLLPLEVAQQLNIPVARFANGKRAGEPKTKTVKQDDYSKPKSRIVDAFYELPGFVKPQPRWASSPPGLYQVGAEVIKELTEGSSIPFLRVLGQVVRMQKDLGTYYWVEDANGERSGMLTLVGDDGIVHHKLNHTSTVTGRFSSSDPNLQNIPKGNKSDIKTVFTSRFGGKLIQSDFSSLEIYVQAILTQCRQLVDDLKAKLDMHVLRLATKLGRSYEELLPLCKGYVGADGVFVEPEPEWDYARTGAKVFSFQRAYGAGAQKIADSTGMSIEDVKALIAAESTRYPEIDRYFDDLTKTVQRSRKPTGLVFQHPEVPTAVCHIGRGYSRTPDGKLYSYVESASPKYLAEKGTAQSFSPTELKNYVVQGGGGEWAKAAMALAMRAFYKRRNFGHRAVLCNQVHDALYADADDTVANEAAALLHACMEAASDYIEYYFNWQLPLPVPSDTTWGANMKEEHSIPGVKEAAAVLRNELRRDYMAGYVPSYTKESA